VIAGILWQSDTDVISNLVAGMEVLQIGCWQGHDTAALAREAVRVVTIGQRPGLDHTGFADQVSMWAVIQRFYRVADHTLILQGDLGDLVSSFTPGQFDVAVIDLTALGSPDPAQMFNLAQQVASKIIMIPSAFRQFDTYAAGMPALGYTAEQCGRVWVLDPAPAPEPAETKEED